MTPPHHALLPHRSLTLCSSLVGTRAHTQEMLDFCGEKGITSDVEVRAFVYGDGQEGWPQRELASRPAGTPAIAAACM